MASISGKCFVFILATFVLLCALALIFACLLRARKLHLKITSATTLRQINYSASSIPSFNVTVVTFLSIKNPNFGAFSYENSMLSVLYEGVKIGEGKIVGDTVSYKETKQVKVTVNVRSAKVPDTVNLSSGINSGSLNLTSYVQMSGTVHLLKIINVRKTVEMACKMKLHFTSHAIQGIQCQ